MRSDVKIRVLVFLVFVFANTLRIQAQKEAYNWILPIQYLCSFDSGYFHFVRNVNIASSLTTPCISDTSGKFLFNVSYDKVYQSNGVVMPNGSNLINTIGAAPMQIVAHPNPDSGSLYFVFVNNNTNSLNRGMYFSVVDMNLNSGQGDVVSNRKNIRIGDSTIFSLGIGLARHASNKAWWVIVSKFRSDSVYAYLLDENGFNSKPVISVFKDKFLHKPYISNIRVSSKNDKISFNGSVDSMIYLCKFNNQNGAISNQINIPIKGCVYSEFSYSGNFLYVLNQHAGFTVSDTLFQYDIRLFDSSTIVQSRYFYDTINGFSGNLQLGPDRKIYFVTTPYKMCFIEDPELKGQASALLIRRFKLGSAFTGHPVQLIDYPWYYSSSRLYSDSFLCLRDTAELRFFHNDFVDSFYVYYDDGNFSRHEKNESFVYHIYQTPGEFHPMVLQYYKDYIDTFYTQLKVIQNKPKLGADLHFCEAYQKILKTQNDFLRYEWNHASHADSFILFDSSYQVILNTTSREGCLDSDTMNIVRTWIQQEIELNDSVFCFEDLMVLGKHKINVLNDTLKSRQWLLDGLVIGKLDSVRITHIDAGLHTLKIVTTTDSICKDSAQVQIKVMPFPKVKIHVNDSSQCLNGNAFEFKSMGMLQNNWTGDDGINSHDTLVYKSYTQAGVYRIKLMAKDSLQCKGEDSIMISVHLPINNKIVSSKDTFCENELIFLKTQYLGRKVQWNNGDTGNQLLYKYSDSGDFQIAMMSLDSNFCSSFDTLKIRVGHSPEAEIEVEQDNCSSIFTLKENLNQAASRFWLYENKRINEFPLTLTSKKATDSVYLVIRSMEYCADTIETILKNQIVNQMVLKIPNVFTPDGDQVNDCFTIDSLNYECGDEAQVEVYNRWGEIVFKGDLSNDCWNGKLLNKYAECSDGTYYCIFKIIKEKELKLISSTLLLIR